MATTINADTAIGGAVVTGDASGVLALQAAGNTALTLNSSRAMGLGASPDFGTSGQLLQSNGSSAAPTWVAASPASAMTLISTQTASSSASISWTGLSGYNHYMLIMDGIAPSTGGLVFYVQVGTGAGPTYITSGYNTNSLASLGNGAPYNYAGSTAGLIVTDFWNSGIRSTSYVSGNITLNNMTNSKLAIGAGIVSYVDHTNNLFALTSVNGQSTGNTTAKTAVRILFDTGNIASGTASLYGITS
jgi:hypothetical protein